MVLKFPSNSPVAHVAANTQPGLAAPAIITVTANRLFAVNKWHGLAGHQGSSVQDQQYQLPVEIDPLIGMPLVCVFVCRCVCSNVCVCVSLSVCVCVCVCVSGIHCDGPRQCPWPVACCCFPAPAHQQPPPLPRPLIP
ncbi:unnamed protein product [Oncorhynchus mykiss]|uniref:Uncharacterized protein n=1 Tax=Oncorhynchus mykiss TaxID=8022 RepID=A0A060YSV2_ONCMY|nr:unnamed protein product [Oncorhynchus mykiss]